MMFSASASASPSPTTAHDLIDVNLQESPPMDTNDVENQLTNLKVSIVKNFAKDVQTSLTKFVCLTPDAQLGETGTFVKTLQDKIRNFRTLQYRTNMLLCLCDDFQEKVHVGFPYLMVHITGLVIGAAIGSAVVVITQHFY